MPQDLSDFQISEYCLVIDILGTVNRMSNASHFADSLLDLLNVVTHAYYETTDIANVTDSKPFFQYADTLIFPNDSTDELVSHIPHPLIVICLWFFSNQILLYPV